MKNNDYEYEDTLKKLSNEELVAAFNRQIGVTGWGNARAAYCNALRKEFQRRDFDSSLIINESGISFARKVVLENKQLEYL